jgi:hypothetical protein
MNNTNRMLSGDNKGYAGYTFEKIMNPGEIWFSIYRRKNPFLNGCFLTHGQSPIFNTQTSCLELDHSLLRLLKATLVTCLLTLVEPAASTRTCLATLSIPLATAGLFDCLFVVCLSNGISRSHILFFQICAETSCVLHADQEMICLSPLKSLAKCKLIRYTQSPNKQKRERALRVNTIQF